LNDANDVEKIVRRGEILLQS